MRLRFLGATQQVTGSCFLLEVAQHRVLIECGLIQGSAEQERYNALPFGFDPKTIDAVVLTHAHLDHSGKLPLLVKQGFQGPIYTHFATIDLCGIMLTDSGFLLEKAAEYENRKRRDKHQELVEPLYSVEDARAILPQFRGMDYDQEVSILPSVRIRLRDAGHILGSAMVEMWAKEEQRERKIVFSGDIGHPGCPILRDPTSITEADYVVMESTYGNRPHRSWQETFDELGAAIQDASKGKGNILIPAFTVGRSQELLYLFHRYYQAWNLSQWHVFLDSPMAIDATKIYEKYLALSDPETLQLLQQSGSPYHLPNLHFSQSVAESMAINTIDSGAIIIAGAGMCNGGRIRHHLKYNISRKNCHIIMVGFQAVGTLGRVLVDGAREIHLWGETYPVAAKIHTIGGLSAHAGQDFLLRWYQQFTSKPSVILVHGEPMAISVLKEKVDQTCQVKAIVPEYGQSFDL